MKLYCYWRSTTSYRVRAALNLKGVSYETVPVDLLTGAQREPEYLGLNPGKGVPTLVLDDGTVLTQSMAILDYLDAAYPEPRLLPKDAKARAKVLAAAHTVALDIHPVNNLRVIGQIKARFAADPEACGEWMRYWMVEGFTALEAQLRADTPFAFGDTPDLSDICILAQVYNARRWTLDLTPFPKIERVENACLAVPAFAAAHPNRQPDAPTDLQ